MGPSRFLFLLAIISASAVCWNRQNPTPSAAYFENVAWGNVAAFPNTGVWVIAGFRGGLSLIYSTDGLNWSDGNVPELFPPTWEWQTFVTSLTYSASQGFLVNVAMDPSYILQSKDGINWNLLNYTNSNCNELTFLTYANNLYLAKSGEDFCVSKDGLNWVSYVNDFTSQLPALYSVINIDGQDMFTGSAQGEFPGNVTIYASANAFNWTLIANLTDLVPRGSYVQDFIQGEGYFLAAVLEIGEFDTLNATLYSSTDLEVWKQVLINGAGDSQLTSGDGTSWYAFTSGYSGATTIYSTSDGINFYVEKDLTSAPQYANSLWFELGPGAISSGSGSKWTAVNLGIVNYIDMYGVNPLTNQFVIQLALSLSEPNLGDVSTFMVSEDSASWTTVSSAAVVNVQYSSELSAWIGVNYDYAAQEVMATYTADFKSWTSLSSLPLWSGFEYGFSNTFAIYAQHSWTVVVEFSEVFFEERDLGATVYTSSDGQMWSLAQSLEYSVGPDSHGPGFGAIAYGNGIYVLLSDQGPYYSSDRITWNISEIDFPGNELQYLGDAAVGGFFISSIYICYFSKDGISWTPISDLPQGVLGIFSVQVPNQDAGFAATDDTGNYWISSDGLSWSQAGSISDSAFDFFACNSNGICGVASSFDNSIFTGDLA